ncbi:uncharacterized protein A1O9_10422 [Exophiala aquamarina CBS 119918]|uniref:Uncharacterized protein n=1 Tax=Exophiala aquamarina CBS 119918 TaxID=1182545 RepID=A0A072P195_9EURO|nr:uncharacterized protein A1O9_10422 [Exophiala aquamarina CBS 119918]KEF53447.1 hypothetical protein A1O9_10422 [Exophiala aquamarina CBS 119918]
MWILENEEGILEPIYQQSEPEEGIGGYELQSTSDRVIAYEYNGKGSAGYVLLYRPGTRTMWM